MARTIAEHARREAHWQQWVAPVALFLMGLALYSINLDKPPRFDELYHVLGARGYLEHGEPRIGEGVYERARYFTAVVAVLFDIFGESIAVGRLPAVFSASLVVSLLFVWVRSVAGPLAGWLAALGFLTSPFAAHAAQDIRFYAPFTLFFWLAAMAVYAASTAERLAIGRLVCLMLTAAVCLGIAYHLQVLTLIGVVGLGIWLAIKVGLPWLRRLPAGYRRLVVTVAIMGVALASLAQIWFPSDFVIAYRSTPLFDAGTRNHFWIYHQWLDLYYPTFWSLFPLAALAALAYRPGPALFCLCVFAVGFLLLSFGGPKSLLYMTFIFPFLFALWGMALAHIWAGLRVFVGRITEDALRGLGIRPARAIKTALVAAAVAFVVLANTATIRTATMLAGIAVPPEVPSPRWRVAAEALEPWLAQTSVLITSSDLDALYFLGGYDFMLSKTRFSEQPPSAAEFSLDRRTGRPVVATPQAIDRIIDCFDAGVIVSDEYRWRRSAYVDDATADLILQRTEPIPLPAGTRILAFHWSNGEPGPSDACADLEALVRPDRRD